ncbi:hypothetical protein HD806DRAFT_32200 [Xylariaceae sp. AK1471]|nr:hypothetical protein HD806DRAFT_32200 [Xylariaceae sp. AK1471]
MDEVVLDAECVSFKLYPACSGPSAEVACLLRTVNYLGIALNMAVPDLAKSFSCWCVEYTYYFECYRVGTISDEGIDMLEWNTHSSRTARTTTNREYQRRED